MHLQRNSTSLTFQILTRVNLCVFGGGIGRIGEVQATSRQPSQRFSQDLAIEVGQGGETLMEWMSTWRPEFMMYLSTDDFSPTSINTRWWWFVARWMFGFGMHKYSYLHYIYICIFTTSSDQMILTSRNLHGMSRTWIDLHLMTWHGRSSPPAPGEFLHLGYRLLSLRHQPVTCVRHKGMKGPRTQSA